MVRGRWYRLLQADLEERTAKVERLTEELVAATGNVTLLTARVEAMSAEIDATRARVAELEAEVRRVRVITRLVSQSPTCDARGRCFFLLTPAPVSPAVHAAVRLVRCVSLLLGGGIARVIHIRRAPCSRSGDGAGGDGDGKGGVGRESGDVADTSGSSHIPRRFQLNTRSCWWQGIVCCVVCVCVCVYVYVCVARYPIHWK